MEFIFDLLRSIFFTDIIGSIDLYTILSTILKYLFVFIVLYFIYLIVRLIFLDIKNVYTDQAINKSYLNLNIKNEDLQKAIEHFELSDYNSIGREYENDLVLDDVLVSRRHAIIIKKNDGFYIEDMKSSNGTYVNDVAVTDDLKLMDGDVITFGDYSYTFNKGDETYNEF